MAMVINSNIASINAQRHLDNSRAEMETAMERLASGERINSAVDDAAGGAIASRMETRVSGMEQLIRNVNDGVSMVQIAESAMGEVNNMLQRMRDLSIQSTNSTLNATDRQTLQLEVDQLIDEINTIAATTQFNGQNILAGTGAVTSIQSGLNAGEAVSFTITGVSAGKLGLTGGSNGIAYSGRVSAPAGNIAAGDITVNGADIGAFTTNDDTAKEQAVIFNAKSSLTGVTADAYNRVEGKVVGLGNIAIGAITVNSTSIVNETGASSFSNLDQLAAAINEQAQNVTAEVSAEGTMILSNTNGEDIVLAGAGLSAAGFEGAATLKGFLKFTNNDGSSNPIVFGLGDDGTAADLEDAGLNVTASTGAITGGAVTAVTAASEAITINGTSIGAVSTASASAYMDAINAKTSTTGVTATSLTSVEYSIASATAGSTIASGTQATGGNLTLNGVDVAYAQDAAIDVIVTAFNTAGNSIGITATGTDDGKLKLTATNGTDIVVDGALFNSGTAETTKGKLTLTHATGGAIDVSSVATTYSNRAAAVAKAGLMMANEYGADGSGLNISTMQSATSALATLDTAITQLSNNRAEMGAYLKRFEAETSNLQVSIEKTASALSAILDADYAVESANLAKAQVLQQAGTAMLAQANASTQNVLSLLK